MDGGKTANDQMLRPRYDNTGMEAFGMLVRCAVCGAEHWIVVWQHWYRTPRSMPEVWICDEHWGDIHSVS